MGLVFHGPAGISGPFRVVSVQNQTRYDPAIRRAEQGTAELERTVKRLEKNPLST